MRVVESEGCRYEVVESKVVESKFVEFMLHSRRGSSVNGPGVAGAVLQTALSLIDSFINSLADGL